MADMEDRQAVLAAPEQVGPAEQQLVEQVAAGVHDWALVQRPGREVTGSRLDETNATHTAAVAVDAVVVAVEVDAAVADIVAVVTMEVVDKELVGSDMEKRAGDKKVV